MARRLRGNGPTPRRGSAGESVGSSRSGVESDSVVRVPEGVFNEFDYRVVRAAWTLKCLTSSRIREYLDLKKETGAYVKIQRSLDKAARHGLLHLTPPRNEELEDRLKTSFGTLDEIHVEVDRTATCLKAAHLILNEVEEFLLGPNSKMVIANAGGRTVRDTVSCLQRIVPAPLELGQKDLVFLSLNAAESHDRFDQCANYISVRLQQVLGGEGARHVAVVRTPDDQASREYRQLLGEIDLLISSVGSLDGFFSYWLQRNGHMPDARGHAAGKKKLLPDDAVGDVAFHLIDERGRQVALEGATKDLVETKLARSPGWDDLIQVFNKRKGILVLAGDKLKVSRAVLTGGWARRCVIDANLASMLTRTGPE